MTALGIDLGGTKLSLALFSPEGSIRSKKTIPLQGRTGDDVGTLIISEMRALLSSQPDISSIGIAVPGIYRRRTGTVWAPNIGGWDDYPLLQKVSNAVSLPVAIASDRACYILGESWMRAARGCKDAIYLSVGTGIGAGILANGQVLHGAHDIEGATGWMALQPPYENKYDSCGCFEYYASGEGIARVAKEVLHSGVETGNSPSKNLSLQTAKDVFEGYEQGDPAAISVMAVCTRFWGMALANLVSLFDPEKIILGGGVFGPAVQLIPQIIKEASLWAQPVTMKLVKIEASGLGADAGLYGAGLIAMEAANRQNKQPSDHVS